MAAGAAVGEAFPLGGVHMHLLTARQTALAQLLCKACAKSTNNLNSVDNDADTVCSCCC
jgi:hypothetical protein